MSGVKVSVIVPVYNVENYLDRCVKAILGQSLKELEIILVDDQSPDNCPKMCDNYALKDSRIKVIHKKNAGLGFARNSGLEVATGEYVAFCDSDDYVDLYAYEKLYNSAKKHDADVVFASFYKETAPGIWSVRGVVSESRVIEKESVKEYLLDMIACAPHVKSERLYDMSSCMSVYRKSIIDENNIRFLSERENASEDTTYNIDFIKHSKRILLLPYTFYFYCLNGSSLTQTFLPEKLDRLVKLREQMIKSLGDWDSDHARVNRFYIGFARSYVISLFKDRKGNYRELLKKMISNEVWNVIKKEYKASNLPFFGRVIYWLTINKCLNLLVLSGFLFTKLWLIKQRRK